SRRRLLRWGFHLPLDERMEQHLTDQLAAVPDTEVRDRYLTPLKELLDARAAIDAACNNAARLAALTALEKRFERIAAPPASRSKADSPTGRGLVWLDTTADWEVQLGKAALSGLGPPLAMILDACRWLT